MLPTRRFGQLALFLSVGLMFGTVAGRGQGMAMSGHAMDGMQVVPRPEQLPVPIHMTGVGNSHIAIKASPEAQVWFDQGLSLLHDFWDYEAAKAFEQGVRVDAKCAMCYWGLYQVEGFRGGPEHVYGIAALNEAVRQKKHVSAAEKLYIEAAEVSAKHGNPEDKSQEIAILRKLVRKEPKDPEARVFLAEAVHDGYTDEGEPKAGTKEAISILESVLRDYPNDSAANHYWIHALEPSNHPERAVNSAARLASLAPNSGHMVHMPGHIYYRVGDYGSAEHWFAESTEADERYMREQQVVPDDDWNYVHNLMYAIANLMEEGKIGEANAMSDRLAAARGKLSTTLYVWSSRDQIARIHRRLPVALRMGDWVTVAQLTGQANLPSGQKASNLRFLAAELTDFATGMAALDNNEKATAQNASARMDAGLWREDQAKPDAASPANKAMDDPAQKNQPAMVPLMPDAEVGPLMQALSIASLELRAGLLVNEGKLDEAKKLYVQALKKEKELGYREPPVYVRPVGETEGAALAKAKDFSGAILAYKAALAERPNSGFALYGLARAEELSGDTGAARRDYYSFLKAWSAADSDLPELAHARGAVGSITANYHP